MSRSRAPFLVLTLAIALAGLSACDKEAGRKQETVGKVESGVGTVIGDKDLKAEGKQDKVVGGVKQGDLKGAVKDAKD
ncbi:CsbD family protein [Caulobacter soli]|uniref:CsbD family protein n=1 Tax=Caulobacter soli TaxID=2708539 RepID=UPI00196B876F|nr:CsbD family protein [Caulobacter soli]